MSLNMFSVNNKAFSRGKSRRFIEEWKIFTPFKYSDSALFGPIKTNSRDYVK